ncbi:MAG TPA: NUDIX domain-containing protein [Pirellulaceae bacterium]|nr:NUDIX domain-containing protein [Pirellulaceae bacterium]
MPEVRSCGVVVFKREPLSFLLMRHPTRWDLPKGHVDPGEHDLECALRELEEETGIAAEDIELDDGFCFEHHYAVQDRRYPNQICDKTLLIYLGWLKRDIDIIATEHPGFEWFRWNPPHAIQPATIDPLLAAVAEHLAALH